MMRASDERNKLPDRRHFLMRSLSLVFGYLVAVDRLRACPAEDSSLAKFAGILDELRRDPVLANSMRSKIALAEAFTAGLERAPIRAKKSTTPISPRASDLIVACEVTSERVYTARYESPVWPGGASGVTVGIGYDTGYVTSDDLAGDWKGYLDSDSIRALSVACGETGTRAKTIIKQLPPVTVSWEIAQRQYSEEVRPRYVGLTQSVLVNTASLSADSLGALVSLVYNRGASFRLADERYKEMRNIREHMASKNFDRIPSEIRAMTRLWKDQANLRGLVLRREAEANLFELGLQS